MSKKEVLRLQRKYQKILLADGGLRTLCNALVEEINNPVIILDKYKEDAMYVSPEAKEEKDIYQYLKEKKLKKIKEVSTELDLEIERNKYHYQGDYRNELHTRLKHGSQTLGFLVVIEKERVNKKDYIAIMQATFALALKLHQNCLVQSLARKCNNELVTDLVEGRSDDKEGLIKRGELAGWDLSLNYQLFVLDINLPDENDDECDECSLYFYEVQEQIIRNLHRVIRTNVARKYIIFNYNDDVVLLIHYSDKSEAIKNDIELIYKKIQQNFQKAEIAIGGGKFVRDCRFLSDSFQEAKYTLEFLKTTNEVNNSFLYDDLGVLRLLWHVEKEELLEFVDEFLADLIKSDQETDNNWLKTLGAYLEERNVKAVAERLHVHPNTVRYRIGKIEEILGLKLDDYEKTLNLLIAYKIYKFILDTD